MKKDLSKIIRGKQKSITHEKGFPGFNEGRDGDITIRTVPGRGIFLFTKINNTWYQTRLSRTRPVDEEGFEALTIPLNKLPKKSGEISLHAGNLKIKRGSSILAFPDWNTHQTGTSNVSPAKGIHPDNIMFDDLGDLTADVVGNDELFILEYKDSDPKQHKRKAISEIKLSAFNNDASFSATTGTVTSVSVSDGSSSTAVTTSGTFTFASDTGLDHAESGGTVTYSLDLPELTDGTANINGALDEIIYLDQSGDGTKTQKRKQFNEIGLSSFSNDLILDEDDMATDSSTKMPSQQSVKAYVTSFVDGAPGALDTLNELAAALNDDASFSTTITNSIATKLPLAGGTLTGDLTINSPESKLIFRGDDTSENHEIESDGNLYITVDDDADDTNNFLQFRAHSGGTLKNIMRLQDGGNVGIGNTDPNHLLHVGDDATAVFGTAPDKAIQLSSTTNDHEIAYILYAADGTNNIRSKYFVDDDTGYVGWDSTYSTGLFGYEWKIANTQKMKLDTSGNLTLSGTVDGRDVATDGTKLDGIETSATADQTAVEIIGLLNSDLGGNFTIGTQSDDTATLNGSLMLRQEGGIFVENIGSPTGSSTGYGGSILIPPKGMFRSGSSSQTGAIKIHIPRGTGDATDWISMWVDVSDYATDESFSAYIQGYMYKNEPGSESSVTTDDHEWTNETAMIFAKKQDRDFTVSYGHDDTDWFVAIGAVDSTWSYLQVTVRDVQIGGSSDIDDYTDDWDITLVTDFGTTVHQSHTDNFPVVKGTNITELGTITTGTWNGGVIASAYLDSDTAHLTGSQTFSGTKTFSANAIFGGDITINADGKIKSDTDATWNFIEFDDDSGSPENQTLISSKTNTGVIVDGNNNGTGQFEVLKGGTDGTATELFRIENDGDAVFTGDITVSGTVDGRDVATDGTKLDGIASGATANTGDITGVVITTDSGAETAATDNSGSAAVSILGSNGVGVTNSGTTITAVAVPGEIDHDSLNNFDANEHFTQANITTVGTLGSLTVSGDATFDTTTLKVDSSNNRVGIGTASPDETLHVAGDVKVYSSSPYPSLLLESSGSSANFMRFKSTDTTWSVGIDYDDNFSFSGSNITDTRLVTIQKSTGNLGIGTTSPSVPLDVVGTIKSSVAGQAILSLDNTATNGDEWNFISRVRGSTSTLEFRNVDTTTDAVAITSAGNVGIGTTSPTDLLEIQSAESETYQYPLVLRNPYNHASDIDFGVGIKFKFDDNSEVKWAGIAYEADATYGNSGDLCFYVDGNNNSSPRMKLQHEGSLTVTHGGWRGITINNSANANGSHLELKNTTTRFQLAVRSSGFDIRDVNDGDTSRFFINSSGNITTGVWNATAITHDYIGADAIDGTNIGDDVIDSEHYAHGSIDNIHIADSQIEFDKFHANAYQTHGEMTSPGFANNDTTFLTAKATKTYIESYGYTTDTTLTTEQVQDIVGNMFTSNTETRVSATYEDGDGTIDLVVDDMTANTTYSAGSLLDLSGTTFNVDLSELTDGTADVVGSADELVYLDDGSQKRKQIDEIKLGQFNNDQSWTSNAGTVTSVGTGTGLDGGAITSSGTISLSFDELADGTADIVGGSDEIIYLDLQGDSTKDLKRKQVDEWKLSQFNNDLGFRDVQIHSFYSTSSSAFYLPFGPSSVEHTSTADSLNDDTLFIPPYSGYLEKIVVHSATGLNLPAGATRIILRVNGSNHSEGYVQATIANETTQTFTYGEDFTFSEGDRIRIQMDTASGPRYVTSTSVWKYTL